MVRACCEVEKSKFSVNSLGFADSEKFVAFADCAFAEKCVAMAVRLLAAARPGLPSRHDGTQVRCERAAMASNAVANVRMNSFSLSGVFVRSVSIGGGDRSRNCECGKGRRSVASVREGKDEARGRGRSGFAWRAQATSGTQSKPAMDTVGFNDGSSTRFAPLINGCWTLAGGHGRIVESEIVQVMEMYARSGLTSFDTADIYGPSESILGAFREQWLRKKEQDDSLRDVQAWQLINLL